MYKRPTVVSGHSRKRLLFTYRVIEKTEVQFPRVGNMRRADQEVKMMSSPWAH